MPHGDYSQKPQIKVIKKKDRETVEGNQKAENLVDAQAELRAPREVEPFTVKRTVSEEDQQAKDWVNESLRAIREKEKSERENLFGGSRK